MSALLQRFVDAGVLYPVEQHFAQMLARRGGEADPEVLLAAALACRAPRRGHVCAPLYDIATLASPPLAVEGSEDAVVEPLPWPEPNAWRAKVAASTLVGDGVSELQPLVLEQDRVYLYRHWRYESTLAERILARCQPDPQLDLDRLRAGLDALWPGRGTQVDLQLLAAAVSVLRRFSVVSGGPGTGKTTTVRRIVALLLDQAAGRGAPPPRIQLLAPTGKAANRLRESLQPLAAGDPLALPSHYRDLLAQAQPTEHTIHSALGVRFGNLARFWKNADDPLLADVIIVDEASMVPLALMAKLVDATRPDARLILVGDKHQLASIEAGAVLGDICDAGAHGGRSASLSATLHGLGVATPEGAQAAGSVLGDGIVHLEYNYRSGKHPGLVALARAIHAGDAAATLAVLDDAAYGEARLVAPKGPTGFDNVRHDIVQGYLPVIKAALKGDAAGALQALSGFRVLCAHRRGKLGVEKANGHFGVWLRDAVHGFRPSGASYPGRAILVTRNDYAVRLFNGDIGILVRQPDGRVRAVFQDGVALREPLAPSRLPPHDTVLATTIHKSQGSQYGEVVVTLPERMSLLCRRELLYTAVTRAERKVTVVATREVLEATVKLGMQRRTGLEAKLLG